MNSIATLLLTNKLAAGVAVAVLASGATVGTFAAQDKLPGQSDGVFFASASPTAHPTEAAADQIEQPEASKTPRDVKGIPTTNSHFSPETDGTCTPGESVVKTTPAGTEVNVPCQAVEKGDNGSGASEHGAAAATERSGNSDKTPGPGNRPEDVPPLSVPTAAGSADDSQGEATVPVPTPHTR